MIIAPTIRLVGPDGEMVGVLSAEDGLQRAIDAGLDLVEVSPNADPPVCKILDHGKFKYEQQKKRNEARKKQKIIEVKEIKMRPGIDEHDYQVKMRSMRRFLDDGDKVKVTIMFRGRDLRRPENGRKLLKRVIEIIGDDAVIESAPGGIVNRDMSMVLGPIKKV